ncbi:MAG: hypothetical protein NTY15_01750 [Planctomycetota bacterium]|nr:hypothetical protein [Planctomycetota bacterium]
MESRKFTPFKDAAIRESTLTKTAASSGCMESNILVRMDSPAVHSCRNFRLPAAVSATLRARESLALLEKSEQENTPSKCSSRDDLERIVENFFEHWTLRLL